MDGQTCFWLLLILVFNLINPAALRKPKVNGTYNATEAIENSHDTLVQRPDSVSKIPSGLRRLIHSATSRQPKVNGTYNATENIDISVPLPLEQKSDALVSEIPSGLRRSFESASMQQPDVNGTYNATESNEIPSPVALVPKPDTLISEILSDLDVSSESAISQQPDVNGTYNATEVIETPSPVALVPKPDTLISEIASDLDVSSESAISQQPDVNGTYNATEIIDIPSPVGLVQSPDALISDIPSGIRRSFESAISQQPDVNGTNNATEIIEIPTAVASEQIPDTLISEIPSGLHRSVEPAILQQPNVDGTYITTETSPSIAIIRRSDTLVSEKPLVFRRSVEPAISQQPNVNGTYKYTEGVEIFTPNAPENNPDTVIVMKSLKSKYLDSEILPRQRRSLEPPILQQINVNGTYNATENIEIPPPVALEQRPNTLNSEIPSDRRSSSKQPNVNGTYNETKSIENSEPVVSAKSPDTSALIITLTPKYLDMEVLTRLRRSLNPAILQQPKVSGTYQSTENIDISPPVASEQSPDNLDSGIPSGLRRSSDSDALQQSNVNETYNATKSVENSPPVASAKGPDASALIITLTPKYLDMEVLTRPRRSLDPAILQPLNVNGTYNATENIDIPPSIALIQSLDTLNPEIPPVLSRSFEPALLRQPNVNGTYNTAEMISSPIATTMRPDTPTLVNSLKSRYLDSTILPAFRKSLERTPIENDNNLESTQSLEKYLQPVPMNITNDVSETDDLPEYNPISIEKINSRVGHLKSEEDLSVAPILRNQTTNNWRLLNQNANTIKSNPDKLRISSPALTNSAVTTRPEWPFTNPYSVHIPRRINQTERIMVLASRKEQKSSWNANAVHSRLEEMKLKEWTEDYILHLHRKYEYMPIIEADNRLWSKYSRAVVENFVLAFYRASLLDTYFSQEAIVQYYEETSYNKSFNAALSHLRKRRGQTALQFAAQPRRYSDILIAIIDTPIDIVQSFCRPDMAPWMCNTKYLSHLMDDSENCSSIWLHAIVHLDVIEANVHKNPADIIIDELETRILSQPSNDVEILFDFIVNTITELRNQLKQPLIINANLYRDVKDLQEKDLLQCLNID